MPIGKEKNDMSRQNPEFKFSFKSLSTTGKVIFIISTILIGVFLISELFTGVEALILGMIFLGTWIILFLILFTYGRLKNRNHERAKS